MLLSMKLRPGQPLDSLARLRETFARHPGGDYGAPLRVSPTCEEGPSATASKLLAQFGACAVACLIASGCEERADIVPEPAVVAHDFCTTVESCGHSPCVGVGIDDCCSAACEGQWFDALTNCPDLPAPMWAWATCWAGASCEPDSCQIEASTWLDALADCDFERRTCSVSVSTSLQFSASCALCDAGAACVCTEGRNAGDLVDGSSVSCPAPGGDYSVLHTFLEQTCGGPPECEAGVHVAWKQTSELSFNEVYGLTIVPDHGVALAGIHPTPPWEHGNQALVAMLDAGGAPLWETSIGAEGDDRALAVLARDAGGLLVVGSVDQQAALVASVATEDGQIQWQRTLSPTAGSAEHAGWFEAVDETPLGDFVAVGFALGTGSFDARIARLTDDGEVIWDVALGGPLYDAAFDVVALEDGRFVLAAVTESESPGDVDAWVVALSADGDVLWEVVRGGPGADQVRAVERLGDSLLLAGETFLGSPFAVGWLFALDGFGSVVWDAHRAGGGHAGFTDLVVSADGTAAVVGSLRNAPESDSLLLFEEFAQDGTSLRLEVLPTGVTAVPLIHEQYPDEFLLLERSPPVLHKVCGP